MRTRVGLEYELGIGIYICYTLGLGKVLGDALSPCEVLTEIWRVCLCGLTAKEAITRTQ